MKTIDILLTTCNRLHFTRRSIEALSDRLITPYRLIVIDNQSEDGTLEYLLDLEQKNSDLYMVIALKEHKTISEAYGIGFRYVNSEYFISMQDDIIIPDLQPDVVQQLIELIEKYHGYSAIACRIQHVPNVKWGDGDLAEPSTALSAYFRISRTSDVKEMGGFGTKPRDDKEFINRIRSIGKKGGWANNLWCNHLGHGVKDRGYKDYQRKWGVRKDGSMNDGTHKPYKSIDSLTNKPL